MIVSPDHWLSGARRVLSENQDARPDPSEISLVVIHGISLPPGEFGRGLVEDLFRNRLNCAADPRLADLDGVRVSAHLFIDRDGAITQFVPFHRRAWHAGVSSWRGRPRCNDFAIGIELEGADEVAYAEAQYATLTTVVAALGHRYARLDPASIVGHNEIAPGRKTDPGPAFDWPRVIRAAAGPVGTPERRSGEGL